MSRTLSLCAAALGAVLAAGLPQCPGAETLPAEMKIEQALASPTKLEFHNMPLEDVTDFLKDYHRIEIQFDDKALEDIGVGEDAPITVNLEGLSLRSALELMLSDWELTYVVQHEVLLITTEEEAAGQRYMTTKLYPVADLLARYHPQPGERGGGPADFDSILEVIKSTIAPTSWDEVGGPGSIRSGTFNNLETLIVLQTYHVHRKIAALLRELRSAAGRIEPTASSKRPADTPVYWPRTAAVKKIEEALKSPTIFEFIDAPLEDVVEFLRDQHHIEIQIDTKALTDVGLGTDLPITKNVKGISLGAALRLVLREHHLTYLIDNEVLLITTIETNHMVRTRLYPVADLVAPGSQRGPNAAGGDTLVRVITSIVGPINWEDVGGPGSIAAVSFGGVPTLVVSQTDYVHNEIAAWLAEFRKVAAAGR